MTHDKELDFDTFIKENASKPVTYRFLGVLVECLHELKRDSNTRIETLEQRLRDIETKGMVYQGVHQSGQSYGAGSVVTRSGSSWHTKRTTSGTPGGPEEADRDWVLMVKKGRDGKDAR